MKSRWLGIVVAMVVLLGGDLALADKWYGTAPFCDGECPSGWKQIKSNDCCGSSKPKGCGSCCWTGDKVLCRPIPGDSCTGTLQTKTKCKGIFEYCYDGYHNLQGNWVTCNSYLCGGCIGWDW